MFMLRVATMASAAGVGEDTITVGGVVAVMMTGWLGSKTVEPPISASKRLWLSHAVASSDSATNNTTKRANFIGNLHLPPGRVCLYVSPDCTYIIHCNTATQQPLAGLTHPLRWNSVWSSCTRYRGRLRTPHLRPDKGLKPLALFHLVR